MVAGLSLQSIDFASVRDPTGSPEFTYDRMINFRISLGLSSSCRVSVFEFIGLFIASGNDRVNGAVASDAEFNREIFLKTLDKCTSKFLNPRPFGQELRHARHLAL
jgi:hypothetical protein